jgi:hypothetical protein
MKRAGLRNLIFERLPAIFLLFFGSVHLYFALTDNLDARLGGGFGMYAVAQQTYLRAYAVSAAESVMFEPKRFLEQYTNAALAWPSESRLTAFAKYLACDSLFNKMYPEAQSVRIERWSGHFANGLLQVSRLGIYESAC